MSITRKWTTYLLLIAATLVLMFPILYAFSISFMSGAEVLEGKIWPSSFSLENYRDAFEKVPLLHYLINSFAVSIFVMAGQLLVSSLAAFAFVFIKFKGRDAIFFLFISTMMIPWEATMVPNFLTAQKLGWINNYLALTIPFFALAFGTFLLRQQFKTIPNELYEASQVAGISRFRFFWNVVLPVSKTSLVTLGVYSFLTTWNMYLWPLLVTNTEDVRTVQIGLKQMQTQEISTDWGVVMAAVVVVILPTLLLLFLGQKRLQKGLTQGAIK
ncbi:carbohydrate ABC transporter permease [Priestia megaterium]|jgi:sn-glycerol 3-phosphate transport system permease protein|uniref:Glycerol-3-phosphate ABC transporter permease n=1 Tax=Priestia megaterium TaxID=1404 RepID=A0AAE5UA62_PRIMG|nr:MULTISPECIES: carbohydrate ABC transporter permease [Priestia]RFB18653.1 carbohydrate ABC transporter permease [Bacillus sp. ALD]RFB32189.1 carbohydrate ABC transporter permease [Bacillus sp. RC]MBM6601900.1 carbohydrate ABC transporter permease [Priestia megaterium]MBV6738193.1 carbohydrate ABC transporter permease [Priestia megaterium]MBW0934264.1 carbohydrate ABC transporter permease [Priestia megaterium]